MVIETLLGLSQSQTRYLIVVKDILILENEGTQWNSLQKNSTNMAVKVLWEL